jgi:hypothetical protein
MVPSVPAGVIGAGLFRRKTVHAPASTGRRHQAQATEPHALQPLQLTPEPAKATIGIGAGFDSIAHDASGRRRAIERERDNLAHVERLALRQSRQRRHQARAHAPVGLLEQTAPQLGQLVGLRRDHRGQAAQLEQRGVSH